MHPLSPDLTALKDDELQKKYSEITTRINQAWRMGYSDALAQLQMLEEDYRSELNRRSQKVMEEMMAKNDKFKGIINVK